MSVVRCIAMEWPITIDKTHIARPHIPHTELPQPPATLSSVSAGIFKASFEPLGGTCSESHHRPIYAHVRHAARRCSHQLTLDLSAATITHRRLITRRDGLYITAALSAAG